MKDEKGDWKAADTALWREHLHAATMAGRVAAARVAVELGYAIEADPVPSGRLGHWKIAGVPDEVMELHSKRAAEIEAECQRRGESSYHARGVAARATRKAKRHEPVGPLVERWRDEIAEVGWPAERLADAVDTAGRGRKAVEPLTVRDSRALLSEALGADGELARRKVFSRRHVVVELAPRLFGQAPEVLEKLVDRALADPEVVPIFRVAGARETVHSLASVLAREAAIAEDLDRQLARSDAPAVTRQGVEAAMEKAGRRIGVALSEEQRTAALSICTSGHGRGARRGRGRRRQDDHAAGCGRGFRASGLRGDRNRHVRPGGPQPRPGGGDQPSPVPSPASSGGSTTAKWRSVKRPWSSWTRLA